MRLALERPCSKQLFLAIRGKLLREAHRLDPKAYRSYTLYSTVFSAEGEAGDEIPSPTAAEAYLKEFPSGPFVVQTHLALAHFYADLFTVPTETASFTWRRASCGETPIAVSVVRRVPADRARSGNARPAQEALRRQRMPLPAARSVGSERVNLTRSGPERVAP